MANKDKGNEELNELFNSARSKLDEAKAEKSVKKLLESGHATLKYMRAKYGVIH